MSKNFRNKSNIETINSFFSNSFVLVAGILSVVCCLLHSLSSTATKIFQIATDTYSGSSKSLDISDTPSASALIGILLIIMYTLAKRNSEFIRVPIKIYSVYTYIQLILSAIACCFIPFIMIIVAVTGDFSCTFMGLPESVCVIIVLFLISALLFFILMVSYIERRYAKSLNESINTATLQKEGAKEYSILCFIFAGISFIMYFVLGIYMATTTDSVFPYIMSSVSSLSSVSLLFVGIVAKMYSEYIPDEEINESSESPYELTHPDIKTDTTESVNPKYVQEIEITNNYEENFYE